MSRAPDRLNISQSPLSRQIKQLEDYLGLILFERRKQRIFLTPVGREFLADSRLLLKSAETLEEKARRYNAGSAGHLDIGYVEGVVWNPSFSLLLKDFAKAFPGTTLKLHAFGTALRPDALTQMLAFMNSDVFAEYDREHQWELLREFDNEDGAFHRRLMYWHARTAQISSELYRALAKGPEERVLFIVGAAHRPFNEAEMRAQPWLTVEQAATLLGEPALAANER